MITSSEYGDRLAKRKKQAPAAASMNTCTKRLNDTYAYGYTDYNAHRTVYPKKCVHFETSLLSAIATVMIIYYD